METGQSAAMTRPQPKPPKRKLGPERSFYQRLFGQPIRITLMGREPVDGVLRWVDRYTLLLSVPAGTGSKDRLIYKQAIESVELMSEGNNARGRQFRKDVV